MNRITTWTTAVAMLALAACDGGQMEGDAGLIVIHLPDAGPGDAGTNDAGPVEAGPGDAGPPDAGPPDPGLHQCSLSLYEPVPETCLPRCTEVTRDCVMDCGEDDRACRDECIETDTAPPAVVSFEGSEILMFCSLCLNLQNSSCLRDVCPDEIDACGGCGAGGCGEPECEEELAALMLCVEGQVSEYVSCSEARAQECFP